MSPWDLLLAGWLGAAIVMLAAWLLQRRTGDAGIVDVVWAIGVGLLSIFFAACGDGDPQRRLLIGVLVSIWSGRLAIYLLGRVMRMPEDGRYQKLRQEWGLNAQKKLFAFFQVQALWSVLFSVPILIATRNSQPLGLVDVVGLVVWLAAVAGETLADRQLGRFRSDPGNKGKVCREGLWRYSRHPNYFFEWVQWWAYVCFGWNAPYGWLTLMGPALMLYFLFRITGIPPTEAHALESRGDAYREYQRTTSVFFPWPPKQETT